MFVIEASHAEVVDIEADVATVRSFFTDIANFIDLMPNIGSISTDDEGVLHWEIIAHVPLVGSFTEFFAVTKKTDEEHLVEWVPDTSAERNFLNFRAEFSDDGEGITEVEFEQTIELRRRSATELHIFAGLAGAALISSEMEKHVAEMMASFLESAKERIEG